MTFDRIGCIVFACVLTACGGAAANRPATSTASASPAPHMGSLSDDGTPVGQAPPEFASLEPARWVNGAPAPLAGARGDVVLVESWHRL